MKILSFLAKHPQKAEDSIAHRTIHECIKTTLTFTRPFFQTMEAGNKPFKNEKY